MPIERAEVQAFSTKSSSVACSNNAYIVAIRDIPLVMDARNLLIDSLKTANNDLLEPAFEAEVGLTYSKGLTGFAVVLSKNALEFVLSHPDVDFVECDHK